MIEVKIEEKIPEINEAIAYIHRNIEEPISLSILAKHVGYSPYHFIRLFKTQTGLSPYYYISSLRLQKAKDLLIHTNLTVRDIAQQIGQQSLGTFTTRFGEKIGVTPSRFRIQQNLAETYLKQLKDLPEIGGVEKHRANHTGVVGSVHSALPFEGVIFIGLFHKPIPESIPVYGTLMMSLGEFQFSNVKPGTYYLMATSISWKMKSLDILLPQANLRTRHHEPIVIESNEELHRQQVTLYPPSLDDPPILISLPLLMSRFLARYS